LILTFDTEATTYEKGNPFSQQNKLMSIAYQVNDGSPQYLSIEHDGQPYAIRLTKIKNLVEQASLLVGFNLKYDLHWLKRYVTDIRFPVHCWDTQLAEFILDGQTHPYPSLDFFCTKYGLPLKDDVVKAQYWDQGIDTPDIPEEILSKYNKLDVSLTYQLYKKQVPQFKGPFLNLFNLHCHY
jgi:DNA polymerase I-like protein with 3'-5' exonuclease and polymerase domains